MWVAVRAGTSAYLGRHIPRDRSTLASRVRPHDRNRSEFPILDRDDAADLMNLVRNELGLSSKDKRFPRRHAFKSIRVRETARRRLKISSVKCFHSAKARRSR